MIGALSSIGAKLRKFRSLLSVEHLIPKDMKQANVIETTATVEPPAPANPPPPMAVQRIESGALERANAGENMRLTIEEVHDRLEFVRRVMQREMREGEDYGKIPGTGEKPTLLQPGAQKLLMTFNLSVEVKKETLREFPNFHREYEFILCIKAPNGKTWDGVGTCSTLEKKYRYRKGERVCPRCGKPAIIKGKQEFGGGWICFDKKGGCKAKFPDNAPEIVNQSVEDTEYENPADYWNTVRKMSYKRALVHGAITATNTSELWTQDVEEAEVGAGSPPAKPKSARTATQARQEKAAATPPAAAPATTTAKNPELYPTEAGRAKMIEALAKSGLDQIATEFFGKFRGGLKKGETLDKLPLQFVPITNRQMWELNKAVQEFADGKFIREPYPQNKLKPEEKQPELPAKPAEPPKQEPAKQPAKKPEPEKGALPEYDLPTAAWRSAVPPYGDKIALGQMPQKKIFGWWANFKPEPTFEKNGNTIQKKSETIAKEEAFRAALDQAGMHYKFTHPDEEPTESEAQEAAAEAEAEAEAENHVASEEAHSAMLEQGIERPPVEDDVPF